MDFPDDRVLDIICGTSFRLGLAWPQPWHKGRDTEGLSPTASFTPDAPAMEHEPASRTAATSSLVGVDCARNDIPADTTRSASERTNNSCFISSNLLGPQAVGCGTWQSRIKQSIGCGEESLSLRKVLRVATMFSGIESPCIALRTFLCSTPWTLEWSAESHAETRRFPATHGNAATCFWRCHWAWQRACLLL